MRNGLSVHLHSCGAASAAQPFAAYTTRTPSATAASARPAAPAASLARLDAGEELLHAQQRVVRAGHSEPV